MLGKSLNAQGYLDFGRPVIMPKMRQFFLPREMEQIEAAYFFSKNAHETQLRQNGTRYFEHPKACAWMVFDELHMYDWELVVILLLHDIIEDSFIMSVERLQRNFGKKVALAVQLLSKEKDGSLSDQDYFERLMLAGSWRAMFAKLIDRLHNLITLGDMPRKKQKAKVAETRAYIFPLYNELMKKLPKKYHPQAKLVFENIQELCNTYE